MGIPCIPFQVERLCDVVRKIRVQRRCPGFESRHLYDLGYTIQHLHVAFPRSRPENNHLRARSLFGGDSGKYAWGNEMGKGRRPVSVLLSRLSLWRAGVEALLGNGRTCASELSHSRGKGARGVNYRLLSVVGWGLPSGAVIPRYTWPSTCGQRKLSEQWWWQLELGLTCAEMVRAAGIQGGSRSVCYGFFSYLWNGTMIISTS